MAAGADAPPAAEPAPAYQSPPSELTERGRYAALEREREPSREPAPGSGAHQPQVQLEGEPQVELEREPDPRIEPLADVQALADLEPRVPDLEPRMQYELEPDGSAPQDGSGEGSGAFGTPPAPGAGPEEPAGEEEADGELQGLTTPSRRGSSPRFLTDVIVDMGLASREQVDDALETSRVAGTTPERVLLEKGAITADGSRARSPNATGSTTSTWPLRRSTWPPPTSSPPRSPSATRRCPSPSPTSARCSSRWPTPPTCSRWTTSRS